MWPLTLFIPTGGWADDVSDLKLTHYSKVLKDKEGLNVLPASTAGLIALA